MWEPLVRDSRRRRREISCGLRPGLVGLLGRMPDMWIERPRRVERTRREEREECVVRRRGGRDVDILVSNMTGQRARLARLRTKVP